MAVFSSSIYPPNELWDYASRLYARGRVSEACLAFQARYDVDVNILLFCCWVASSGRGMFHTGELESALKDVAGWRKSVVGPLNQLKKHLKGPVTPAPRPLAEDLRRVVVESELHAEHAEVLMLHAAMTRAGTGTFDRYQQLDDSIGNLYLYFSLLGVQLNDADLQDLVEILSNAFPGEQTQRIMKMCETVAIRMTAGIDR